MLPMMHSYLASFLGLAKKVPFVDASNEMVPYCEEEIRQKIDRQKIRKGPFSTSE